MMDRAIYASITELNLLPVQSRKDRGLVNKNKQRKKQRNPQIRKHKLHQYLGIFIQYFTAIRF